LTEVGGSLRTLVIGIDGADWQVVKPMVGRGELPNLAAMMQEGTHTDLLSVYPHNSVAAWASFQTGLNPGRHGLYDFYESGTYERAVVTAERLRGRTMWEILSQAGCRVGAINVPVTYPPRPVNGFLIPGVLTPQRERVPTYPPGLLDGVPEYVVEPVSPLMRTHVGDMDYLESLAESIVTRGRIALQLARDWPWDFLAIVFTETDRLQHFFWKVVDPTHPAYDPDKAPALAQGFQECYRRIDRALGALKDLAGEQALVMVVSDHGFGPVTKGIDLTAWLAQLGYLAFVREGGRSLAQKAYRLAQRLDVLKLRRFLPSRAVARISRQIHLPQVDWRRTTAYPGTLADQGIYINLKGREPGGTVEPGAEYEALRDRLIVDLASLAEPQTGGRVVSRVLRREEVLSGEFAHLAPDLFLEPMDETHVFVNRLRDGYHIGLEPEHVYGLSGHHRKKGIFVAAGPCIQALGRSEELQIVDICPTVLYAMGVPAPDDLDGHIIRQIFSGEFKRGQGLRRARASEHAVGDSAPAFLAEEEKQVRDRLRGLGYL